MREDSFHFYTALPFLSNDILSLSSPKKNAAHRTATPEDGHPATAYHHRRSSPLSVRVVVWKTWIKMGENMNQFQQQLTALEIEAEHLLLARHQVVENDRLRNGNREALTALRKKARTTKTSVPSPFESIMKEIGGLGSKTLVQEVCAICGNHDSTEDTWMMFPGTDIFAQIPFHAAHTVLEKDQEQLDFEVKKLQNIVKEKSLIISEKGALSDKISPGVLRSLVTLTDKK